VKIAKIAENALTAKIASIALNVAVIFATIAVNVKIVALTHVQNVASIIGVIGMMTEI